MKHILMLLFFCLPVTLFAQDTAYVSASGGLKLYSNVYSKSPVTAKMLYGEQLLKDTILYPKPESMVLDGIFTSFFPVIYKGQKGYALEAFLLAVPPPAKGTKTMTEYAEQVSEMACEPIIHTDSSDYHEYPAPGRTLLEDTRILYKNGMIYTEHSGWLTRSKSLIIQGVTIRQAYIIAKNITELNDLIYTPTYPNESMSEKTEEGERGAEINRLDNGALVKLSFWEDGIESHSKLSIYMLNTTQVVITIDWSL